MMEILRVDSDVVESFVLSVLIESRRRGARSKK